jgi:nitronate monooxygenase
LKNTTDSQTTLTNIFTGRPGRAIVNRAIRELGPISDNVPDFPLAAAALGPLRSKAEAAGSGDFTPLWSGQAARLSRELPAAKLTKQLATETIDKLRSL